MGEREGLVGVDILVVRNRYRIWDLENPIALVYVCLSSTTHLIYNHYLDISQKIG